MWDTNKNKMLSLYIKDTGGMFKFTGRGYGLRYRTIRFKISLLVTYGNYQKITNKTWLREWKIKNVVVYGGLLLVDKQVWSFIWSLGLLLPIIWV